MTLTYSRLQKDQPELTLKKGHTILVKKLNCYFDNDFSTYPTLTSENDDVTKQMT